MKLEDFLRRLAKTAPFTISEQVPVRTYPPFALLAACFSLLLGCTYEPPADSPANIRQPAPWFHFATAEFAIDLPTVPTFREYPGAGGLVSYVLASLYDDTLLSLSYTDHERDVTSVLAYQAASTLPGAYNAAPTTIAGRTALGYSLLNNGTNSHNVVVPVGRRLYLLSAVSRHAIDTGAWSQFKQSFHIVPR